MPDPLADAELRIDDCDAIATIRRHRRQANPRLEPAPERGNRSDLLDPFARAQLFASQSVLADLGLGRYAF